MNKKRVMDIIICCISAAIIILCYTYIEQKNLSYLIYTVCGVIFLLFFVLAVADSERKVQGGDSRNKNAMIQELALLDEEENEVSVWHIGGKTAVLIGRDAHKENVDINLQNTKYGGMVDCQHAVLNYAGNQWYIEDLNSKNGVQIQCARDRKIYNISQNHLCKINKGDILYIGNTRLKAK